MDIKLGTSTITVNALMKYDQQEIDRRIVEDRGTTSGQVGYLICGYC